MDNLSKKQENYQQKSKIWQWITIFAVLLSLISGSVLLYQWWKRKQNIFQIQEKEKQLEKTEQKQTKAIQTYQKQQKQLPQVLILAQNPTIYEFFNNLLGGYAYRFAEKENLTAWCLPLKFGGFYQNPIQDGENHGEMGNCFYQPKNQPVIISLNQIYLLNKLGQGRYLTDPESYLVIDFNALIKTCSHELAHYFQFSKHGMSSCESSRAKDMEGEFICPELVSEHTALTRKIMEMIINSNEFSTLEKYRKNC